MDLYEAMRTTRAVRRLRPDPVDEGALRRVLEAATFAPSGGNLQPWRAIVIREPETKRRLQALYAAAWREYAKARRALLASAPEPAREKHLRSLAAGDVLAESLGEAPVIVLFCFHPGLLHVTDAALGRLSVVGGASLYPAVQNLLLACRVEGLGATLTTLLCEAEPALRELLGIPEPWAVSAMVPIGHPQGRGHGPVARNPVEAMCFAEGWGKPLPAPA